MSFCGKVKFFKSNVGKDMFRKGLFELKKEGKGYIGSAIELHMRIVCRNSMVLSFAIKKEIAKLSHSWS